MNRLFEGLRAKDLRGFVESTFTIDHYTSKMGEDKNIAVLAFKVNDKMPATDLMEFIEKGYTFVLDADISAGEERDGKYQVFVELERNDRLPKHIKNILEGVGKLCDIDDWRFRYHKDLKSCEVTEDNIMEYVPLSAETYSSKILQVKTATVESFFNQTPFESIQLDENDVITVTKPFSGYVDMKLLAMGNYTEVKDSLPGGLQLDEASQSQVTYLEKYLGNYEIAKINNKFLIRNGNQAVIVAKERW